ncbi:MAG: efflux RND transporter periplasmic adaptor subunit [Armatimonadetes bacterium]|nr:efflux RND transporter periplasmic adaptor subunit [Armatimonadota bacterium]
MKKAVWIVGAIVIAICGIAGIALRGLKKPEVAKAPTYTVSKGDLESKVVESGTINAIEVVEVKSQVGGRVKELLVEEGDVVTKGQLIAVIDPRETRNTVEQNQAQLRGAQASVTRAGVEIAQRRVTSQAAYDRAKSRLLQLEKESNVQPQLTRLSIQSAKSVYEAAVVQRDTLLKATQPNERIEAQNAVREAESTFNTAQAEYKRESELLAVGYSARRDVEVAKNSLDLAKSRLENAKDKLKRLGDNQALELKNAQERVVQAKADFDRAKANQFQDANKRRDYEQAVASLRDAEAGLRDIDALIAGRSQSQASVDQIKSSLNESQRQLGETEVRSPIDGVVSQKKTRVGETVSGLSGFSAGTSIVTVEDRRALVVKLQINEIDVAKLEMGMDADIEVDAIPSRTFAGKVSKISPASTASSAVDTGATIETKAVVKYNIEIKLQDVEPALKSGMTAKCTVVTAKRTGVVQIPYEYLGIDGKKRFVMIAPAKVGGAGTKRDVTVGLTTGTSVEITSGLKVGEILAKPDYKGPERKGMQMGRGG